MHFFPPFILYRTAPWWWNKKPFVTGIYAHTRLPPSFVPNFFLVNCLYQFFPQSWTSHEVIPISGFSKSLIFSKDGSNHWRWFSFWSTVWQPHARCLLFATAHSESCLIFWSFGTKLWGSGVGAYRPVLYMLTLHSCHQGAELLSAKGGKMHILSVFRVFWLKQGD